MTNPSRVAFSLFGRDIYWYGVLMALGILIAVAIASYEGKRKNLPKDTVLDLALVVIPSGLVGARLYYVLFELENYLSDPIRMLYVWEGGLAIYGAVIGGALGAFLYCRKKKISILTVFDIIAPGLVLAQALGRWGNFFNQEAFGLPVTDPDLLWFPLAVKIDVPWNNGIHYFNGEICDVPYHLATFFYESMWCLLVFLVLWFVIRKRVKHRGDVFFAYVILYAFERMFVEGLRGDSLWLIPGAVRVSQALSFVLFVGVLAFVLVRRAKEKKLGVLIWPAPLPEDGAVTVSETDEGAEEASAEEIESGEMIPEDTEASEVSEAPETTSETAEQQDPAEPENERDGGE